MTIDPFLVAVGLIGNRELTDELLNEVLSLLPRVAPELTDAEIIAIRRQLESSIGVSMSVGQGLHDGEIAPWLGEIKASLNWNYWDAYAKQLKSKNFGQAVIRVLDEDTDNILNECGNPAEKTPWQSKGLVMGDVQSGKTANYCGLISKAADTGYMVIVLLTGMIEDLRSQSQERLDEGFVGRDSRQLLDNVQTNRVIGAGRFRDQVPNVLTSIDSDFLRSNHRAIGGIPLVNIREPVLLVMKKNKSPLSNLVSFIDSQLRGGARLDLPLLLIDDEADNASVNGKKDEDPATINKLIRDLIGRFSRSSYVGYTATPFANVFINPDIDDLFPSNFVYSLNTPTNYLGVASFFSDSPTHGHCVQDIEDAESLLPYSHRKDHPFSDLPQSLWNAVRVFLLSCAIRDLRDESMKHRSMLVNASRFTDVQGRIANAIKAKLYELAEDIKQYLSSDERWGQQARLEDLHQLWLEHYSDCGFNWDEIRAVLYESISTVAVVTVNQKSDDSERLNYAQYASSRFGRRIIAVGGLTLSRGLTLEGLCVSYFYRNSKAYDTLLQMGRWFGYRPGYDDLCRLWIDPLAATWYNHLSKVVDELRYDIRRMHANGLPPSKFGMRVKSHPDALIITALSKMRNADDVQVAISYSGFGAETPLLPDDILRNQSNLQKTSKFLKGLLPPTLVGKRLIWQGINKKDIANFLEDLEILDINAHFLRDHVTKTKPLLDFIGRSEFANLSEWDICLPQGEGDGLESICLQDVDGAAHKIQPRKRQFEKVRKGSGFLRLNKQRVGDASDELVGLDDEDRKTAEHDWELARSGDPKLGASIPGYFYRRFRRRPLLTIHVIEPSESSEKNRKKMMQLMDIKPETLVAIGISFPQFDGEAASVVYTLNKVALRGAGLLIEGEDDNDEDED
ncbi:Z1 domain-containing protein [Variovorax boronicumulans]|uniref:Z1 domain-containing protein n=1 Tax=Variovorax boronicumulans TaxID=436515 RepID=UPI0027887A52|nr:Z1 domain-containing protein [Variovorax boronicumulans]MDQ0045032.1 hypothetical protein [Variovorax boronicumulans]